MKIQRSNFLFAALLLFILPSSQDNFRLGEAEVRISGKKIVVSTGIMERTWVITEAGLLTTGISDLKNHYDYGHEKPSFRCDWDLPGRISDSSMAEYVETTVNESDDEGFISRHLQVVSTFRYPSEKIELQHIIWVFPGSPGIRTQLRIKALPGFSYENIVTEDSERMDYGHKLPVPGARSEYVALDFVNENSRRYWGYYNNPGSQHYPHREMLEEKIVTGYPLFLPEESNWASGICIEYAGGRHGLCLVKESPKCVNQQSHVTGSFFSGPQGLQVTGWGLTPEEIITERFRECWATWSIVWTGGNDGMQLALKQFDRVRYPAFPERDMFILSNTWGPADPLGHQFTEEDFLLKEIPALADVGVDVMQIDDGWQKGGQLNSAHGFEPRYRNGWKDLKSVADKYGIRFGLWITARLSETQELKKNLDELGFISWKVDFDKLTQRSDYEDRIKKYRDVMKHSWMKTQFTLCPEYDDPRYGWYYCKEYGSIYFQNIQESLPAHLTMVPYQVLRQHWLMAKYFNANKLQVMLQNPKRVNGERSDAPLHSHSYCFAMGAPFVPCFFQSAQLLDQEGKDELRHFISIYKENRQSIFTSYTFPIGDKPDNASWTGFQMIGENQPDSGYLLIFREIHNMKDEAPLQIKFLSGRTIRVENLYTSATEKIKVSDDGKAVFRIKTPGDFLFLKYSAL